MKPAIIFRADGSPKIGMGHIVRCIALAHMLKDEFDISFFSNEIPPATEEELACHSFRLVKIQAEDSFFNSLSSSSLVVLDGYGFGDFYQVRIRNTGCRLICIDDMHDKAFFADLIINHSPGVTPQDYLARPYTHFSLGLEYALLRPEFLEAAISLPPRTKHEVVFINFGGSDPLGLTLKALETICRMPRFTKIHAVAGPAARGISELHRLASLNPHLFIHHALNGPEMARLMEESDLAVVPASGILLEALASGLVPVTCYYADNQKKFYEAMTRTGNLPAIGFADDSFSEKLALKITDTAALSSCRISAIQESISRSAANNLLHVRKIFNSPRES